jgi:8-hydroxy-5-deazaflavin:NADPH oxidoreductase
MDEKTTFPIIAILGGTGKEGSGLALRWASAGCPIIIGSRSLEKAQAAAADLNNRLGNLLISGMTNEEAAKRAEICVLTVVPAAHQETLINLKDILSGKIVVDATARVDYKDPKPPVPPSAGRIAQDVLGKEARVVAAFQNVPASVLKRNPSQPLDTDVLVCSDDPAAAEAVIHLAELGGMRGYYAGSLDNAVVVEGLTSILISLNKHYNIKTASIGITGIIKS